MGEWKYLTIGIAVDPERKFEVVVSWDDQAGRKIAANLHHPERPALGPFLMEAEIQEWVIVSTRKEQVLLKRFVPG